MARNKATLGGPAFAVTDGTGDLVPFGVLVPANPATGETHLKHIVWNTGVAEVFHSGYLPQHADLVADDAD